MSRLINGRFSARLLTLTNTHTLLSPVSVRAPALRSRRAAVKNGTSCATPLADLCPVRNAFPCRTATTETLAKGLRPLAPASHSPIFRASLVQTSAALRPFHFRCALVARVGIPLGLQLLPPQAWAWAKALLCEQQQHGHSRAKTKEKHPCRA